LKEVVARVVTGALLCAIGSATIAQEAGGPIKVQTGLMSSPINTSQFYPAIDAPFVRHLLKPENYFDEGLGQGPPNNLVAGNVTKEKRGMVNTKFPAINATGWTPPDCTLAVGQNHVVATVNSSIAFFTKSGTKQFQQTFEQFFTGMPQTTFLFDPKVFYDRVHQRFVTICLEKSGADNSKMLLAISDDNDPNGTWHRYRFDTSLTLNGNEYWLDYPGWGYNKDAYIISGNMFPFASGGFGGVQFLVIPSASILSGGTISVTSLRDPNSGSVQIAEMIDPNVDRVYGINAWNTTRLGVYALENLTTTPAWQRTLVTIPAFTPPSRDANSTNGRTLDSLDSRVYNASWRNGKLVAAHNTTSGNLAARWYEINTGSWPTSGSPSLNQSGNISGDVDYHMPAISQNAWGDIGLIFTRSSASITADIMYAARSAGDPAGTMGAPNLLESSAGNNYSQGRWGDYFKVDVDPVDDSTFWGIGMGVNASNGWTTSIFSFSLAAPVSGWVRQDGVGLSGVTVQFKDGGGNVVASGVTDGSGNYSVMVSPGTWTVAPIHNDKYFFPSSRSITVPPPGTNQNFTAANIGPHSLVFEYPVVYENQGRRATLGLNVETPVAREITISDNSFKLTSPVKVTVPAGQRLHTFWVYGAPTATDTLVTLTATHQGLTATGQITVRKLPAPTGITLANSTKGGRGVSGSVGFDKPAVGAMYLVLASDNTAVAQVSPGPTALPHNASSKAFYCKTFPVASTQVVTISATFYGQVVTKPLTVTP